MIQFRLKVFLLTIPVLCLTGCPPAGPKLGGKILGKWKSESAVIQGCELPAGAFSLEFEPTGRFVYTAGSQVMTGTCSSGFGGQFTFELDQPLGRINSHKQKITFEGDWLVMVDSDGTRLRYSKSD